MTSKLSKSFVRMRVKFDKNQTNLSAEGAENALKVFVGDRKLATHLIVREDKVLTFHVLANIQIKSKDGEMSSDGKLDANKREIVR